MEAFASLLEWDGGLSLLPPLVAILLAWLSRRVLLALVSAAVVGAIVVAKGDPVAALTALSSTLYDVTSSFDNATITGFSLAVAATVGVMGRSGGTRALVSRIEKRAKGRQGTMVASWLAGWVVFFDDYANCLVVGSSMGPLCDRNGVSRAKLAYIVDATAAPVASIALVSTWVGYEVGLIAEQLQGSQIEVSAFSLFIEAIPYRFYCLLTLVFVGAIAISGRDFGPMAKVERSVPPSAAETQSGPSAPLAVGLAPILTLIFGVFGILIGHGAMNLGPDLWSSAPFEVLDAAMPFFDMFLGAVLALIMATVLGVAVAKVPLTELGPAALSGTKAISQALMVLYLAWTLGGLIKQTEAAPYVASLLAGRMPPELLPAVTFMLAGATAFSTGSSYFTMGVLLPLVMPLALTIDPTGGPILLASMAAVLDGAVLGDHVSPISDTTILSSLGSGVDLMTHVRTQMPYALVVGAVAVLGCAVPAGYGMSPFVLVPIGAMVCVGVVMIVGRPPPDAAGAA